MMNLANLLLEEQFSVYKGLVRVTHSKEYTNFKKELLATTGITKVEIASKTIEKVE